MADGEAGGIEVLVGVAGEDLAVDHVEQQPRGHVAVSRFAFDTGLGREDHRLVDLLATHPVIQILHRLLGEFAPVRAVLQPGAGADELAADVLHVEWLDRAVGQGHGQFRHPGQRRRVLLGAEQARLLALLAVEDVGAGNRVLARAHEFVLHEVLDQLDLQFPTVGGKFERLLRHGGGHEADVGTHLGRQLLDLVDLEFRPVGAFQGKLDADVGKRFQTAVALADEEAFGVGRRRRR